MCSHFVSHLVWWFSSLRPLIKEQYHVLMECIRTALQVCKRQFYLLLIFSIRIMFENSPLIIIIWVFLWNIFPSNIFIIGCHFNYINIGIIWVHYTLFRITHLWYCSNTFLHQKIYIAYYMRCIMYIQVRVSKCLTILTLINNFFTIVNIKNTQKSIILFNYLKILEQVIIVCLV